jgi:hypothetical protein
MTDTQEFVVPKSMPTTGPETFEFMLRAMSERGMPCVKCQWCKQDANEREANRVVASARHIGAEGCTSSGEHDGGRRGKVSCRFVTAEKFEDAAGIT